MLTASPAGTVENAELPSCDSCLRQPATLLVTYPDARFRVCHDCLDPHLDQVVKSRPARNRTRSVAVLEERSACPTPRLANWAEDRPERPQSCA